MPTFEQQVTFLYTTDLTKTAEFYESILELPLILDQEVCRIYQVSADGFIGFCTSGARTTITADGVILTLVSKDVDGWYKSLSAKGVRFEQPPTQNAKFNIYHCFLRDPNGYLLEIQTFLDPKWPKPTAVA